MSWAADEGFQEFISHHGVDGFEDAHAYRQRYVLRELRELAASRMF